MTAPARPAGTSRGPGLWGLGAGVLLVVAAGCITVGLQDRGHPLAAPVSAPTTLHPAPVTSVPSVPGVPAVARSVPVSLRVPAVDMSVPLSTLGLNFDGTVQVPTNDTEPGWFKLGPTPGQIGSSVILGHVDSTKGPGVFFQLRTLVAGDQVQVSLADGAVVNFAVTSVVMYPKNLFPAREVYASHGDSQLQLVTCGGTFDSQTGHYLSNIVVYTTFVSAGPPTATASSPAPRPSPSPSPTQVTAAAAI